MPSDPRYLYFGLTSADRRRHIGFFLVSGPADDLASLCRIASNELKPAVNDHLRRVYRLGTKPHRVQVLPARVLGRRVFVLPSAIVEIIDVIPERNHISSRDRLLRFKKSELL